MFDVGRFGDNITFVTDVGWLGCRVAMPTAGTAALALEKTMKLCFSRQSSNLDKRKSQSKQKKVIRHV